MQINLRDFSPFSDGTNLDTQAFQKAIDYLHKSGGGSLIVPAGKYLIGTIRLRSNITIELERGAEICGSTNLSDYSENGFFHNEFKDVLSLIYAISEENICIRGEGSINFNGIHFFSLVEQAHRHLTALQGYTPDELEETVLPVLQRPNQPLFFHDCRNIVMDGITLNDALCWTKTFSECSGVKISGITVNNHLRIPNNDGIHITASNDVIISDSRITCADDCIAITCITNWDKVCSNITVSNCILEARSAAIRLGHLESKIRNVLVDNIIIKQTNRGICMFAGKDGFVENVIINNVIINSRIVAGGWWGNGEAAMICAPEPGGYISNVTISNAIACASNGVVVFGNDNIQGISLTGWRLTIPFDSRREKFDKGIDLAPYPNRNRPGNRIFDVFIEKANVKISDFISRCSDDLNDNVELYYAQ